MTRQKKALHPAPPSIREAPRSIAAVSAETRGYPSAADLVSSSSEWKGWLEGALRSMLKPVAIAGAVGAMSLAATGCGGSDTKSVTPAGSSYATLTPLAPVQPPAPATVAFVQPAGSVVVTPIPAAPEPAPATPPPRRRAVRHVPVAAPAQPVPVMPNPPDIEGDIAYVHP